MSRPILERRQVAEPEFEPLAWHDTSPHQLLMRIKDAGIRGMGGAGFPTHLKLQSGINHGVRHVLANGVECEPFVNADLHLLQNHAEVVWEGLQIVGKCLGCNSLHLVVSSPSLHKTLCETLAAETSCLLVPNKPANGEERRLIELTLNEVIPQQKYPSQLGIVVLNVATIFAIFESVRNGQRPTDRLVTLFGEERWVRIGTHLSCLASQTQSLLHGSESTGRPAEQDTFVTQETNAVAYDRSDDSLNCIHCGWCNDVCPKELNVEAMYRFAEADQLPEFLSSHFDACFDCGACVVACPSRIPLQHAIRQGRQRSTASAKQASSNSRFHRREVRNTAAADAEEEARQIRLQSKRTW